MKYRQLIKNFSEYKSEVLSEEALLAEGRLSDVMDQYPGLAEPKIELIQLFSENDPSGNNKYLKWMVEQFIKEHQSMPGFKDYMKSTKNRPETTGTKDVFDYFDQPVGEENNFVYDQVIEMRPDIVHNPHQRYKDSWFFKCKDNELSTDLCKYNIQQTNSEILIGNWYWRMNSNTHNKFSKIHDFLISSSSTQIQKTTSFHSVLIDYFYKNPYKIYKGLDSLETVHVKTPDDLTPI